MNKTILVTGAGGFIGGHLVAKLLRDGHRVRAVDKKATVAVVSEVFGRGESDAESRGERTCVSAVYGCDLGLQSGRGHGRNGIYRAQQGPLHAHGVDQHPHADGGSRLRGDAFLLFLIGVCLCRLQTAASRHSGLEGRGCLPGRSGRRLWLGKAL